MDTVEVIRKSRLFYFVYVTRMNNEHYPHVVLYQWGPERKEKMAG